MALTVLTDQSTAQNSRTLSFTIPSLAVNDVVVVAGITWDNADTLNAPTGTGLTFTQRVATNQAAKTKLYFWTAVASSGGTNVVVSVIANTSSIHNGVLWQCPTADGYSLAATPNTASNATLASNAAAQVALSGASGNLACVIAGDWNGASGASRAWLVSATEDLYQFSSTNSTQYGAHCTLTGTSTTVGLSAPTTGCSNAVAAIEILKSAGGSAGTFTANAGDAPADGGSVTFTGAATFTANAGDAPADGGSVTITGAGTFSASAGDAPADGGSVTMTGAALFSANAGDAPADGGSVTFSVGGVGSFSVLAGDAPADGGSVTFTGAATFSVNAGDAPADGGSVTFIGGSPSTFVVQAGDAPADGGTVSFTGAAVFSVSAGDAPAVGGSASFTVAATLTALAGDAPASGGSVTMTGGAVFGVQAGDATAAGGSAIFIAGEIPILPTRAVRVTLTVTARRINLDTPARRMDVDTPQRRLE